MSIKQGLSGLYLLCKDNRLVYSFKTLRDAITYCRMNQLPYILEV